jgi:MFS family permease
VTSGITLSMLFLGGVSDKIGVRKALVLSFLMFAVGRVLIALAGTLSLGHGIGSPMFFLTCIGLLIMVVAYGLYQPAAYAGVKRYTTPQTAAMGYAVIYGLMNLGAFFSGFISPLVRHNFTEILPPNGLTAVFWAYAALVGVALLVTVLILNPKTDAEAVARLAAEAQALRVAADPNAVPKPVVAPVEEPKINNLPFAALVVVAVAGIAVALHQLATNGGAFPIAAIIGGVFAIGSVLEFMRHRPDHPFRDARFTFFIFVADTGADALCTYNWLILAAVPGARLSPEGWSATVFRVLLEPEPDPDLRRWRRWSRA